MKIFFILTIIVTAILFIKCYKLLKIAVKAVLICLKNEKFTNLTILFARFLYCVIQ